RSPREAKPREPSSRGDAGEARNEAAPNVLAARPSTQGGPAFIRFRATFARAGPPPGVWKPHSWRGSPKKGEGRVSSETLPSVSRSRSHPRPAGPRSHAQRMTRVLGAVLSGVDGIAVEVEVRISAQLPRIDVVGLPEAAVRESAARVRAAIGAAGHRFP